MSGQIIGLAPGLVPSLNPWLKQAGENTAGFAVRNWALGRYHYAVQDIFGYHALQLGATSLETLMNSRIAHRWMATDTTSDTCVALLANASALPFFEATLDLVTLPFTLDAHSDPDAVLDEVARVLVPEGRAIFVGFNAFSLWGLWHLLGSKIWPSGIHLYGQKRLLASLTELGMVAESIDTNEGLLSGKKRIWSSYGSLYFIVAKKRVMGATPLHRKAWRLPSWSELPLNPFPNPHPRGLGKHKDIHISLPC